jgi:hypothetical protein
MAHSWGRLRGSIPNYLIHKSSFLRLPNFATEIKPDACTTSPKGDDLIKYETRPSHRVFSSKRSRNTARRPILRSPIFNLRFG